MQSSQSHKRKSPYDDQDPIPKEGQAKKKQRLSPPVVRFAPSPSPLAISSPEPEDSYDEKLTESKQLPASPISSFHIEYHAFFHQLELEMAIESNLSPAEFKKEIHEKLGNNIFTSDSSLYFKSSSHMAQHFLEHFFANDQNLQIIGENLESRSKRQQGPKTISFTLIRINQSRFACLISLSNFHNENDKHLRDSIEKLCASQPLPHILTPQASPNSHELLINLLHKLEIKIPEKPMKGCVEKSYISFLTKLFLAGVKVECLGSVAVPLDPSLKTNQISSSEDYLTFTSNNTTYSLPKKKNCKACQTNYPAVMTALMGAKRLGQEQKESQVKLSPLFRGMSEYSVNRFKLFTESAKAATKESSSSLDNFKLA